MHRKETQLISEKGSSMTPPIKFGQQLMVETEKEFKKRVTKIYTDWVDRVSDDLEFKTHFTMEEVCQKWSQIAWDEVNK